MANALVVLNGKLYLGDMAPIFGGWFRVPEYYLKGCTYSMPVVIIWQEVPSIGEMSSGIIRVCLQESLCEYLPARALFKLQTNLMETLPLLLIFRCECIPGQNPLSSSTKIAVGNQLLTYFELPSQTFVARTFCLEVPLLR
jgi:hypothetical protein